MKTVGMFEAKTRFSEIIKSVTQGNEICLTNRDRIVAYLVPADYYNKIKYTSIFDELKDLKKRAPIGNPSEVINMRDEGRK